MLVEVFFDCDDPGPEAEVSLERPRHGGRGGAHPNHGGRKLLEVTVEIEVIHSSSVPGLSVLCDKLGSITDFVMGGTILAEETPAAAEDEEEDGDADDEDDHSLGVIKLGIAVLETGKKLVAERSEAETQQAIKLK